MIVMTSVASVRPIAHIDVDLWRSSCSGCRSLGRWAEEIDSRNDELGRGAGSGADLALPRSCAPSGHVW